MKPLTDIKARCIAKKMRNGLVNFAPVQKEAVYQIRRFYCTLDEPPQDMVLQVMNHYFTLHRRSI